MSDKDNFEEAFFKSAKTIEALTKERDFWKADAQRQNAGLSADHSGCFICPHCGEDHHCPTIACMEDSIKNLEAENAEWVAKSHAWLTASMAQDDEITNLKASLEAWEDRVNTDGAMWAHQRKDLEQKLEASEKKVEELEEKLRKVAMIGRSEYR